MRTLLPSIIMIILLMGCSNFYPIFLTTPTDEIDVPDTSMPVDTIDSAGNYLSRDTLFNGVQKIDSSFTSIVSYTVGDDSNLTTFYTLDSIAELSFIVRQNGKKVDAIVKVIDGIYHLTSSYLLEGLVYITIEEIDQNLENLNSLLYLEQSSEEKQIDPTYGLLSRIYQYSEILYGVDQVMKPKVYNGWVSFDYEVGDTLNAYFNSDTLLDVFIVDSLNLDKWIFEDPTIEYVYKKNEMIERVNIVHYQSEELNYVVQNNTDSIMLLTDSIVQIR